MSFDYATKFLDLRKKYKLSQKDLSRITEIGQTTISDIEMGKKTPNALTVEKICDALKIELTDFYKEIGEKPAIFKTNDISSEDLELLDKIKNLPERDRKILDAIIEINKNKDDESSAVGK